MMRLIWKIQSCRLVSHNVTPYADRTAVTILLIKNVAVIPLHVNGVVDVGAHDVPDNDVLAHALSNATNKPYNESYNIRCSSVFVNEYARVDSSTGQWTDEGPAMQTTYWDHFLYVSLWHGRL